MPHYKIRGRRWLFGEITAESKQEALSLFDKHQCYPEKIEDENGDESDVITRCEACRIWLTEDDRICRDVDAIPFCMKCWTELENEIPNPEEYLR